MIRPKVVHLLAWLMLFGCAFTYVSDHHEDIKTIVCILGKEDQDAPQILGARTVEDPVCYEVVGREEKSDWTRPIFSGLNFIWNIISRIIPGL